MTTNTRKLGLTTSEAARRLGVSLSTIRRWSDLGYIRGYRTPGGQRRFTVEQLDEFLVSLESGGPVRQAAPAEDEPAAPATGPDAPFGLYRHHEEPDPFADLVPVAASRPTSFGGMPFPPRA